jgi:Xaa-Pro aminopeptidase
MGALFLSLSVYEERARTIRAFLKEHDCRALLVFTGDYLIYTTGFSIDVATWERPVAAALPLEGDPFMVLNELSTHHFGFAQERKTCWVKDASFYVEHPRLTNRTYTYLQWADLVADRLKAAGISRGRVAVDSLGAVPAGLRNRLPDLQYVSAAELLRDMRNVKCAEERQILHMCGEVSDYGQKLMRERFRPGRILAEIGYEVTWLMSKYALEKYPDDKIEVRARAFCGGRYTASPHGAGAMTGLRIAEHDIIIDFTNCFMNDYSVENERTFIVGTPTDEERRAFNTMVLAQKRATETLVEGRRMADVDGAAQRVIEMAGYGDYIMHRTGHGRGLQGHEYPADLAFNNSILVEGVCITPEPGIYIGHLGGFRHSDTVLVGKHAPDSCTHFPRELADLIV